jgi:hypothetical protein
MATAHSYAYAVGWIALNDESGTDEEPEALEGYISVLLVADIYDKPPRQVALDVYNSRSVERRQRRVVSA